MRAQAKLVAIDSSVQNHFPSHVTRHSRLGSNLGSNSVKSLFENGLFLLKLKQIIKR